VAPATLIAAVPIAFVFIVSQRALLRGLVSGATRSQLTQIVESSKIGRY
jgi:ABC-type maltose transport system permease subunit